MKILHTGDWHIGSFKGPEENGVNLRGEDTKKCLEALVERARTEKPDYTLASGDIFDKAEVWQSRSHSEVLFAKHIIEELAKVSGHVVIMRGTPNHDSKEAFEELAAHFEYVGNVEIVTTPEVLSFDDCDIALIPGFDRGRFRANHPGLGKDEEHQVLSDELGDMVEGLKAMCDPGKTNILMAHYTVPGANTESGQIMMFAQFEPILPPDALQAADFDLVALGHIHRPQQVDGYKNCFYCGAVNQMTFNDEGQERGFYIHELLPFSGCASEYVTTPYREFLTIRLDDDAISAVNRGEIASVSELWNAEIEDKIVRVLYNCTEENRKALNTAVLERELYRLGAFYVKDILPDKITDDVNKEALDSDTDPEKNLITYLRDKSYDDDAIAGYVIKAKPIIEKAQAQVTSACGMGLFEPVEIEVKNYRNYEAEKFSFDDISFCTINGANGAGKSSLFMDAIVDCLYEEPREGELTGWIRNAEDAKSGAIIFTFRIGEKTWRVTRTRTRSGKVTLNLSELVDGEWTDRSMEKARDTQEKVIETVGMDSRTFKSCALIMQDQYGLFLEAPAKERMAVLSKLLGLEIYETMAELAAEKAKEQRAKVTELKNKTVVQTDAIAALGDPDSEIVIKEAELSRYEKQAQEITELRDAKNAELLTLQEAQERLLKLKTDISTLEANKANAEAQAQAQRDIIAICNGTLDVEGTITEKADEYRTLSARKQEINDKLVLYQNKVEALNKQTAEETELATEKKAVEEKLNREEETLKRLEDTANDAEILAKAEEYRKAKEAFEAENEKKAAYHEANLKVIEAKAEVTAAEKQIMMADEQMNTARSFYGKDIAILASDCGCLDIEKASCKFLEKAKASEKALRQEEENYKTRKEDLAAQLEEKKQAEITATSERDAIGYDKDKTEELAGVCSSLKAYADQAEEIAKRAGEAAIVKASIENRKERFRDVCEKLMKVQTELESIRAELETLRTYADENALLSIKLTELERWVEEEKKLPVIRERHKNASERLAELSLRAVEIERDIALKNSEAAVESAKSTGYEVKAAEIAQLNNSLATLNDGITTLKMSLGALNQRKEQIESLKAEIKELQREETKEAELQADYEILKTAFGQDGIPHQIVRSIIPRFTDTANQILGQMTGGKMGVGFKLERVQTNKKEVVTLDAIIDEYGKAALPYLSKSGGEKVKASLAVILALAEIKSQAAGVQLGMLFIDEPPFLDGEGIQAYCDALDTIQRRYNNIKIMAITHDPTMKARFPQNLDVIKTDHGSKVIYQ